MADTHPHLSASSAMRRTISSLAVVLSLFACNAIAQTHCVPPETTFFSCKIAGKQKVASLCGTVFKRPGESNFSDDSWLQYRFGRLGVIEFRYPSSKQDSISKFQGEFHRSVQGSDDSLWFINNGTTYAIEIAPYYVGLWAARKKLPCSGNVILETDRDTGFTDLVVNLSP